LLNVLVHERQILILTTLADMRADMQRSKSPVVREATQKGISYFETNKDRIVYDQYRVQGFPIGTGMIKADANW
jgi:hypothetical protein